MSNILADKATEFGKQAILKLLDADKINNFDNLMMNCLKSESVPCVKLLKKMAKNHEFSQEVVQAAKNTGSIAILDLFGVLDIQVEEEKSKLYRRVTQKDALNIRGMYQTKLII